MTVLVWSVYQTGIASLKKINTRWPRSHKFQVNNTHSRLFYLYNTHGVITQSKQFAQQSQLRGEVNTSYFTPSTPMDSPQFRKILQNDNYKIGWNLHKSESWSATASCYQEKNTKNPTPNNIPLHCQEHERYVWQLLICNYHGSLG
jgi:hypothetical protein